MKLIRDEKQLTVKIDTHLFNQMKKRAVDCGMSIKQWVSQAFIEKMLREDKLK